MRKAIGDQQSVGLMSAFAMTMSFRIEVTTATFAGFPASIRL